MRLLVLGLFVFASFGFGQTPVIQSVLNSASYQPKLAPGSWAAIFGSQLASTPAAATSTPFPTELNGVTVTFGGRVAPLSFVSSGQINALIPFELGTLIFIDPIQVPLVVTTVTGTSAAFSVTLQQSAPAIYSKDGSGTGPALAFDQNFKPLTTVVAGSYIVVYATGLGPTFPPARTYSLAYSDGLLNTRDATAEIGGVTTNAIAALAPGLQGIYQVNLVPQGVFTDDTISIGRSPPLTLPVPRGTNTRNVAGSIEGLYPATTGSATTGPITISELLTLAKFTATFDIVPNAAPFNVTASAGPFSGSVFVDPPNKRWQWFGPTPSLAAQSFDFSGVSTPVLDFVAGGNPFPGNVVPFIRADPIAIGALKNIPAPGFPFVGANGNYATSGSIPDNGHLTLTGTVGGFTNYPKTVSGTSIATAFTLQVDLVVVSTTSVATRFQ